MAIPDDKVLFSPIGRRIHVTGNSCAGKSTLGERLSDLLDTPFVDIDALNWQPNWISLAATNPDELTRRLQQATAGDFWVVAGSYANFSEPVFWSRLETVVWIDLPLAQLVWRVLKRSWRRYRSKELLWGTNYEQFWPQLMVWRKQDSLLWWIVTQYQRKRSGMLAKMTNPRWRHIRFIRLTSSAEVESFVQAISAEVAIAKPAPD